MVQYGISAYKGLGSKSPEQSIQIIHVVNPLEAYVHNFRKWVIVRLGSKTFGYSEIVEGFTVGTMGSPVLTLKFKFKFLHKIFKKFLDSFLFFKKICLHSSKILAPIVQQ